ncbi:uncharacterized protein TNCT_232911 [Trichonephila clavata]|uniref:Uncharacterized protein n=1 Tax=Trichonephila clavata TaxID=2740835 RepID=A0A8X6GDT1_TRICU|nr:uncharacterized protein TNCT_232911 [Trichonephila clavata]
MSCSCGNIHCYCEILCYCLKKSCFCEKCSTLIHRLCNICGLPFDSEDQFRQIKSENVCSCFLQESTIYSETSELSKPEKIMCYVPVPVFYPLPVLPNLVLPPMSLRNVGIKTNQSIPRSLELSDSSSIEPSNNSTSNPRVSSKDSGPVLNSEQLPRDVRNERNISLPVEETKESSSSPAFAELDKNSNPPARSHLSTVLENYDLLKEQFKTSMDLSESDSKSHSCANRNQRTNSAVYLVDPEQSAKVSKSSLQSTSEKSEPRRNSNLVAPSKDATRTDPFGGNRLTQFRNTEQDVVQFIALKDQRNVSPETLMNRLNFDVQTVPLMNQPDHGRGINFKVPANRDLVLPTSLSNLMATERCSSLESSALNNPANTLEASCIYQNPIVSLWHESWHPEPYNKSSLVPVKRLVDRTFNNKLSEPDSNPTNDVKSKQKDDFQSAKWAHTKEWLDSLPPAYP